MFFINWRINMLLSFFAGNIIYNLVDDGIANALGLETLRHGANPLNHLGIRIFGGDPSHGGKKTGSTHGWVDDNTTSNYFYVFKDSEYSTSPIDESSCTTITEKLLLNLHKLIHYPFIGKRLFPKFHSFLSTHNFTTRIIPNVPVVQKTIAIASGLLGAVVTPTLRFRTSQVDASRFENDHMYRGCAYKTAQKVEMWRLGIFGSLLTGINVDWFSRVQAKPLKVVTGVAQLTCAVALGALVISAVGTNPILIGSLAVGALLA